MIEEEKSDNKKEDATLLWSIFLGLSCYVITSNIFPVFRKSHVTH